MIGFPRHRLATLFGSCLLVALGCGDKSTSNKIPEAPSSISGHGLSSSSLIVNWSDNSDNESNFIVYKKWEGNWIQIGTTAANQISFVDSLLEDTTIYIYRLTAKSDAGESVPSDTVALTTLSIGFPPQIPLSPSPADNAIDVSLQPQLYWSCSDPDGDSLKYDIYFGSGGYLESLDSNLIAGNYDLSGLLYNTAYDWKILAKDNFRHVTAGPVWHFRTRPNSAPAAPFQPIPVDDSQGVSINTLLNWSCDDPDGDTLTYDVFFGQGSNLTPVANGIPQNSYNPGQLSFSTQYSWRIIAKDTYDNETRGPLWNFVTRDSIYQLTVLLQGLGNVTIFPNNPGYAYGDSIILTAIADSNWTFSRWSGDIIEIINPLTIIITRNMSIIANFSEGHQNSATISGTITWPGHALSPHTYFFADSLNGSHFFTVGQTAVNPATGNYTLTVGNMPGPIHLLFEGQDDVNNSGAHNPLDAGDGWGYFDYNANGQWGESDTMTVTPGDHVTGIDIELHLITADKAPPGIPTRH